MKFNNRLSKIISKTLNETLKEKADSLVSKIKGDVNELGGMSPDVHDSEHPFYNLNASKMSKKEMNALMKKHYGKENYLGSDEDEKDKSGFRDIESFKKRRDYKKGMAESHDSEEMFIATGGKKYHPKRYKNLPLRKGRMSIDNQLLDDLTGSKPNRYFENDINRIIKRMKDEGGDFGRGYSNDDDDGGEVVAGRTETCECGGEMREGRCNECGYKTAKFGKSKFDYVEQMNEDSDLTEYEIELDSSNFDNDIAKEIMDKKCKDPESQTCKKHMEYYNQMKIDKKVNSDDEGGELDEKLYGRQRNLDHNKNGRIDSEDLRMARQKGRKRETDEEVEEGNAFTGALDDARDEGKKTFKVGNKEYKVRGKNSEVHESYKKCKICGMKNCKCNHKKNKKEKVKLSENELIDLIEGVVKEQKLKYQSGQPKGLQKYKQVYEKSGKENKDYLSSVSKKMKDYLKDGSNGDFEMQPKVFPKNNGQLKKMNTKKYTMSDDGKEFLDDYMRPGMESLVPDNIEYDEKWVSDNIKGSSMTGNNPEWANAEETDLGEKINKKRKAQKFHKAKMTAYRKSKQPVTDGTGENSGSGVKIKVENISDKKIKVINEEFERMKDLISYDRKTQ